jgi:hypothetical protein
MIKVTINTLDESMQQICIECKKPSKSVMMMNWYQNYCSGGSALLSINTGINNNPVKIGYCIDCINEAKRIFDEK